MESWKSKITSRKFLLCIGAIAVVLGTYLQGLSDVTALITGIVAAVGTYQVSEAVVDAARAKAGS